MVDEHKYVVTLTKDEMLVLEDLAKAWNGFLRLPEQNINDRQEFMHLIHAAQNMVMSRPTVRLLNHKE